MLFHLNDSFRSLPGKLTLAFGLAFIWGCQVSESPTAPPTEATEPALAASVIGAPTYLPGRLDAEDYWPNVSNDLTPGNAGGVYRNDNVDIGAVDAGGYAVGWTQPGEWIGFTVVVTTTGNFNLVARMASAVGGTKTIEVTVDGGSRGSFSFTDASGWNSYKNATLNNINLTAGAHIIRFHFTTGNVNLNYVDVVNPGETFSEVFPGPYRSFFRKPSGTLWASGYRYHGALGDGADGGVVMTPTRNLLRATFRKVAVGLQHTLFLTDTGILYAVGDNESGQLGDGSNTTRTSPVEVMRDVKDVFAGWSNSFAVKNDGSLWGTGQNTAGQLGDGTFTNRKTFGLIMQTGGVRSLSVGANHVVIVTTVGQLLGIGSNMDGQLGLPAGNYYLYASPLWEGASKAAATERGTVVLRTDGTVWVFGREYNGELGSGNLNSLVYPRLQILSGIKDIGCGIMHSLFLQPNGALLGAGSTIRMGTGANEFLRRATRIRYDVAGIAVTAASSFYTDYSGIMWGTGLANAGQLGAGPLTGFDDFGYVNSWNRVIYW